MKAIIFTGYERSGGLERVGGAYRIATVLRKEGWDIEVVDFFYHWTLDQLKELIKIRNQAGQLSWVGFSATDRKSTRLNSSHSSPSRMPSSA